MDVIDSQFYDQCLQEWCSDNPEYKTSFKDLASILGKTEIETERIVWRFQEPLSLVTEVSTMAYLKCKDDISAKLLDKNGMQSCMREKNRKGVALMKILRRIGKETFPINNRECWRCERTSNL